MALRSQELVAKRLNRAERRAKQRAENAGRAKKMQQARRAGVPEEFQALYPTLSRKKKKTTQQEYHIGCSGWFYWHWKGRFYPGNLPTGKWFDYYRSHFDTVELNASFYSWPTLTNVRSWLRQAKTGSFVYTVKVSELITHVKKFRGVKSLVKDFGFIADLLGPRMGCFLFQFPASYTYTAARLRHILTQLEPGRRNVVEFRHASWWQPDIYNAFEKAGAIFCSCSGPKLPNDLVKTTDDIYVRFHGSSAWYRHDYSKAELQDWAKRIKASKAKRVWIYFNNDFEAYAIKNAHELYNMLTIKRGTKVKVKNDRADKRSQL